MSGINLQPDNLDDFLEGSAEMDEDGYAARPSKRRAGGEEDGEDPAAALEWLRAENSQLRAEIQTQATEAAAAAARAVVAASRARCAWRMRPSAAVTSASVGSSVTVSL